jgi:hypothetical protein
LTALGPWLKASDDIVTTIADTRQSVAIALFICGSIRVAEPGACAW